MVSMISADSRPLSSQSAPAFINGVPLLFPFLEANQRFATKRVFYEQYWCQHLFVLLP